MAQSLLGMAWQPGCAGVDTQGSSPRAVDPNVKVLPSAQGRDSQLLLNGLLR